MIVDIFIVIVVLFAIAAYFVYRSVKVIKAPEQPVELARAARLLDQVRATDEAIPAIPKHLRNEIDVFLDNYYTKALVK